MSAKELIFIIFCLTVVPLGGSCGQVRPVPASWDATKYAPIPFSQLKSGVPALSPGQQVRCRAYFWQFLEYDPAPGYYYFNQLRHPLSWGDLQWFALYGSPEMHDYFDRVAMDSAQERTYQLHRLDPIILYGELVPLGGRQLYLRVHHIQKDEPY
ncbi:MAG: hypothetical protein JRI57_06070 [Deltaproteobacteria bacterium]|nr:hypothetical protein [Deltaproteobacteria bacterium]MBW1952322.1 hypothetical protein [Deltaproteobacteria bacterium]MBW1986513.1 hypothetical protein [Deltaproteobacteria bacterium]MBW2135092.1 hypothetical protein [Deltaproteobacteria bacterium]